MSPPIHTYVRQITNLSDARYCAGMGVSLLGFVADPNHADYVSPELYKEIMGWVSGPARVLQIRNDQLLPDLIQSYAPELLHIPYEKDLMRKISLPLVVEMNSGNWNLAKDEIMSSREKINYLIFPTGTDVSIFKEVKALGIPFLLSYDGPSSAIKDLLSATGAQGLALKGSAEIKPGLKDYDQLSGILEELNL